jgi:hypothetical protein
MLRALKQNFAPEGASVLIESTSTGETADPVLIDKTSGEEIIESGLFQIAAGPAADPILRERMATQYAQSL